MQVPTSMKVAPLAAFDRVLASDFFAHNNFTEMAMLKTTMELVGK